MKVSRRYPGLLVLFLLLFFLVTSGVVIWTPFAVYRYYLWGRWKKKRKKKERKKKMVSGSGMDQVWGLKHLLVQGIDFTRLGFAAAQPLRVRVYISWTENGGGRDFGRVSIRGQSTDLFRTSTSVLFPSIRGTRSRKRGRRVNSVPGSHMIHTWVVKKGT